jgi:hypothetical protein
VPEDPMAVMMGRDPAAGPKWELALDPTAAATGVGGAGGVGAGLAGAHGMLGRCTWYRVRLASAAMEGG